jgi:UDP-glucose 4-epimerase
MEDRASGAARAHRRDDHSLPAGLIVLARVLVTGGAGFIGSHVADALLARGHDVTVFDDLSGGFTENVPDAARFVQGSVSDADAVGRLFAAASFDYVYHLAAYAAEGLSHFIRRFNYTNNVIGSVNVINASINSGVKGFVFSSSIAVYGSSGGRMREDATPVPEDPYGIAKLAVEQDLRASHAMFGLRFVIFRPHNVYGPRQNIGDRYRNVVGIFMNQILQGRPMTIFGDGTQTRAFSYIDDVAPVMAEAIDCEAAWGAVFNVGADETFTLNELASAVARAMGVEPHIVHLPARQEARHAQSSHERLARTFDVRPSTALAEGLKRMAEWARSHGARTGMPFGELEVTRNLPSAWRTP